MTRWTTPFRNWLRRRQVDAWKRLHVGKGSSIDATVQVYGWKNVRVGHHSILCEETLINAMNRATDEVTLAIGDHCFIGRRNYFNTGRSISLGDYCLTAGDCRFIGSGHSLASPLIPYLAGETVATAVIAIGPNCWIGQGATILGGVKVGHGSVVGAASVVVKDVPPLSIVVGNPGRVIKRYSFAQTAWLPAAAVAPEQEEGWLTEEEYLARLRASHPSIKGPLLGSSRRFGDF